LAPYDDDWLYTRAASIAYQLYMRGKVGVNTLRKHYSGKKRNGTCTEHTAKSAGKCIRYCLQQLENAGLVGKMTSEHDDESNCIIGKTLTKKGTTDMDRIASLYVKELKKRS
jgi:small subunit ribosomal protein S19e